MTSRSAVTTMLAKRVYANNRFYRIFTTNQYGNLQVKNKYLHTPSYQQKECRFSKHACTRKCKNVGLVCTSYVHINIFPFTWIQQFWMVQMTGAKRLAKLGALQWPNLYQSDDPTSNAFQD